MLISFVIASAGLPSMSLVTSWTLFQRKKAPPTAAIPISRKNAKTPPMTQSTTLDFFFAGGADPGAGGGVVAMNTSCICLVMNLRDNFSLALSQCQLLFSDSPKHRIGL